MTSIPYAMNGAQFFIELACFGYLIILIVYTLCCSVFFRQIMASQPWVIRLLRNMYEFTFKVLYIPLITIPISSFDCYWDFRGMHVVRAHASFTTSTFYNTPPFTHSAGVDLSCTESDFLQIVTMIVCIVYLFLFLVFTSLISVFIFPHHSKKGFFFFFH
jgi:hypothetical protein